MTDQPRDLEPGIQTDLAGRLSYAGYLQLDRLLQLQQPLSEPAQHDEMLFITLHQVAELWMKLMIHELRAAIAELRADRLDQAQKIFARIKRIQAQLFEQWSVLETLTPADYLQFRDVLGSASGFQSLQYRLLEFLLGNKHPPMLQLFAHDAAAHAALEQALAAPSLYDEVLRLLARRGHQLPAASIERDWATPYHSQPGLLPVLKRIYENPTVHWDEYALCEQLVDIEENFQLWRFRHMKSVERIIGHRRGTGGSSGVEFLKRALDMSFFPELLEVRTLLGNAD